MLAGCCLLLLVCWCMGCAPGVDEDCLLSCKMLVVDIVVCYVLLLVAACCCLLIVVGNVGLSVVCCLQVAAGF